MGTSKRKYTVRITSDDIEAEHEFWLTPAAVALLLEIAQAFNAKARFSVDIRMSVESVDSADFVRVTCPWCNKPDRKITAAGALYSHGQPGVFPPQHCEGSGRRPSDFEAIAAAKESIA